MNQIARIQYMEKTLDKSLEAISELRKALEKYQNLQAELEDLMAYYDGPLWRKDFEEDEAGKLPTDLKRGVLSEDGVYNMLTENIEVINMMKKIVEAKPILSKA